MGIPPLVGWCCTKEVASSKSSDTTLAHYFFIEGDAPVYFPNSVVKWLPPTPYVAARSLKMAGLRAIYLDNFCRSELRAARAFIGVPDRALCL